MKPARKQQEYRGEDRRDQHAAGKSLHHAEYKQHGKAAAVGAADRCKGKERHRCGDQPPQGQDAREQAGQGDRDHFRDQIGGLDPAHRIRGNRKRLLDRRQRRRHHLDVEDGHEHAKAHQEEAGPGSDGRRDDRRARRRLLPVAHWTGRASRSPVAESAWASVQIRIASTAALSAVKISASRGRCKASGSSAISPATTA